MTLTNDPKTEGGRKLRKLLDLKWDAETEDGIVVKGSYRMLALEVGYATGDDTESIRDCIERLWKVSIIVQCGKMRKGYRLLSQYTGDAADGKLYVALNPRITQAIMGQSRHVRISMDEVRAIHGDATRLMHQRLCGWIDVGKFGKVEIGTLCSYVWPDSDVRAETQKKRRQRARGALRELVGLGWTVQEYVCGKFKITRPGWRAN
jgi:hypothetical protein